MLLVKIARMTRALSGIYEYLPMAESRPGLPLGEITRLTQPLQVTGSGFPMKANFSFVVWSKLWYAQKSTQY